MAVAEIAVSDKQLVVFPHISIFSLQNKYVLSVTCNVLEVCKSDEISAGKSIGECNTILSAYTLYRH